jgi:anthranilate phosphoribosyltransferase
MQVMLAGEANEIQIAALLIALRTRGEDVAELAGFLEEIRARMTRIDCKDEFAVDLCGTGGDGSGSFNLSTAAALVASAGGVTVAKHGNRAVSSQCGSADFIEALGIPILGDTTGVETLLAEQQFAFLFAPLFHPAFKSVAPVRKALGVRTVFNLLGPLANPAKVKRQMMGVFHAQWLEPMAQVLARTGSQHVLIVHGAEGIDEISANGPTMIFEYRDKEFTRYEVSPQDFGIESVNSAPLLGGTASENAARFMDVASGKESELREWIIVNAAPAFYLSGKANSLKEGADLSREVILSGRLLSFLNSLKESRIQ